MSTKPPTSQASEPKIHVSLSKLYVDGIDELIKEGVYMDETDPKP